MSALGQRWSWAIGGRLTCLCLDCSLVELVEQLSLHRSDPSLEFLENLPAPVAERTAHGDDVRYAGLYKYLGELGSGSFGMAAHRS